MKQFLHKRWHSIPVGIISAVLVICLVAGGAFALSPWFEVLGGTADVTVEEAISIANTSGDGGEQFVVSDEDYTWTVSLYPNEMKALFIDVSNASSGDLEVIGVVDPVNDGNGVSVTGNDGVALAESVTIPGEGSGIFALEVHAAGNAEPGARTFQFTLNRK